MNVLLAKSYCVDFRVQITRRNTIAKKAAWLILRHRAKLISINRSTFVAMKGTFIDWAFFCDFKGVFSLNLFVRFDCVLIFAWVLNKRTGLDIACRTKLTQRNLRLSKLQKTA